MVANLENLSRDDLIALGFLPTIQPLNTGDREIDPYLQRISKGYGLKLVRESLEPTQIYKLHTITLPTGEEYHLADSEFPLIEKSLRTLEQLTNFFDNPSSILRDILRILSEKTEPSIEDLELEERYILGEY